MRPVTSYQYGSKFSVEGRQYVQRVYITGKMTVDRDKLIGEGTSVYDSGAVISEEPCEELIRIIRYNLPESRLGRLSLKLRARLGLAAPVSVEDIK